VQLAIFACFRVLAAVPGRGFARVFCKDDKGGDGTKKKRFLPCLVLAGLLGVWEIGVGVTHTPLYVLPPPSRIGAAFGADFPALARHAGVSLGETAAGLALSVLLGVAFALLMDRFPAFRAAVYPLFVVSQTVPVLVLAPIFILYLGFGMAPKILTVVLMCFFPVVVNLADALAGVDAKRVNLLRSFGGNTRQVYTVLKLPAAAPALFSGLTVSATYSVSGAGVGEMLASSAGLGYYLLRVKNGYMLDRVFACVLMVVLLSLLLNLCVKVLEMIAFPYKRKGFQT
jgi:ABC-type nitrate/sulfonate/bicarbonate transport system permease component